MNQRHLDEPVCDFVGDWRSQVVATAIHDGHELSGPIARAMSLDEDVRLREEDPFTARIARRVPDRVLVHRSRFEVDLNRGRDEAVYRTPDDCWGLEVWRHTPLAQRLVDGSLAAYDGFYARLAARLDRVAARGPFVLYDVHSYNHRRDGVDRPSAPAEDNPEVNVGTGSLDRDYWSPAVEAFIGSLSSAPTGSGPLDVRENVRFTGAHLARWVHERYPGIGCVLALEFKKTFMDEWSGVPDEGRLDELGAALGRTTEPVLDALRQIGE
ncbi:N-formylglutamate amidohydrolase [Cumulibacter manganitolerans]|uniref:N-formylglutamate amidohydrolase n=1 Tax=Cumulibacter manganitolerans TaxID=1884992 RepID=UPI001296DDDE|nr:N-formylglutamate amidohydrolase [Cumulibacter manganitolerans]